MSKRRAAKTKQTHTRRWKPSKIAGWVTLGGLAVAIVVLGFVAFAGNGDALRRPTRQDPVVTDEERYTIDVQDNWFAPDDLTVRQGTEITWKFKGDAAHDVTQYEGEFGSDTLGSGDEYILTFEDPGTYEYYCTLHHGMTGKITVLAE
jgi:plastocyanin